MEEAQAMVTKKREDSNNTNINKRKSLVALDGEEGDDDLVSSTLSPSRSHHRKSSCSTTPLDLFQGSPMQVR